MNKAPAIPGITWQSVSNHAQLRDFLMMSDAITPHNLGAVNASGEMVAAGAIVFDFSLEHENRAFLYGAVKPDYQKQGIGRYLVEWMEAQARNVFSEALENKPAVLRFDRFDENPDAVALYEKMGFSLSHSEIEMRRDLQNSLPQASLPGGFESMNWTPDNRTVFHEVYSAAFRERPGFPDWTLAQWEGALIDAAAFRADLSLLIVGDGQGAGYVASHIDGESGWIAQMGVHPVFQKQGLGATLLAEVMQRYRDQNLRYAMLDVNVNNPAAQRLYERLGFESVRQYSSYQKRI